MASTIIYGGTGAGSILSKVVRTSANGFVSISVKYLLESAEAAPPLGSAGEGFSSGVSLQSEPKATDVQTYKEGGLTYCDVTYTGAIYPVAVQKTSQVMSGTFKGRHQGYSGTFIGSLPQLAQTGIYSFDYLMRSETISYSCETSNDPKITPQDGKIISRFNEIKLGAWQNVQVQLEHIVTETQTVTGSVMQKTVTSTPRFVASLRERITTTAS